MLPSITETTSGQRVVLGLRGDFDLLARGVLEAACQRTARMDPECRVHVDLSAVGFVDVGSVRLIAALLHSRHALGDPSTLVVVSPFLRELVQIAGGIGPDFIVESLDEAA